MWFWWFMEIMNCFIPAVMIVCGWFMWKHYPKNINHLMGYRTKRSMKNEETWKFGNEYCGRLWFRIGFISLIPSMIVLIPFTSSSDDCIGNVSICFMIVQLFLLLGSIIPTEKALKKTFDL